MINIFAPVNPTGYGVHSKNLIAALYKHFKNEKIFLQPIGQPQLTQEDVADGMDKIFSELVGNSFIKEAPSICIYHQDQMHNFHGRYRVGYPVFELDKFTKKEKDSLSTLHYFFTPSNWGKQVLRKELSINDAFIHVVPEGVNPDKFIWKERSLPTDRPLKLLNIGKFEVRKGHLHILDLLRTSEKEYHLYAHWNSFFTPQEEIKTTINKFGFIFQKYQNINNIKFLLFKHTDPEIKSLIYLVSDSNYSDPTFIKSLIEIADLGLFPYLAEGWCLPLSECMASGLPCIATNYSGPTQYLTWYNSYRIDPKGSCLARDGKWFNGQGYWADLEINQIQEALDSVQKDPKQYSQINSGLSTFSEKNSWDKAALEFLNGLKGHFNLL